MPIRAFESIKKIVEDFFGGATFSLAKEDSATRAAKQGENVLVKRINTELDTYRFILRRNGLPFTDTERKIADEVAEAFHIFFIKRRKGSDITYFRTALLSSLLDVSVSRYLRFNRHSAFWSIQKLLQLLKTLSFQRHEGKPATSGFIVYCNQIEEFNVACSLSDCLRHDFNSSIGISANFFKSPLTYLLVNGMGTYYVSNINMQATGMIKFMNYGNRDAIERLSLRDTLSLLKKLEAGAFAVCITPASELEVMTCPDNIFVWRKGSWSLFDPDIYRSFLSGCLVAQEIESLITTVYSLSKLRLGTIVLIADENVLVSGDLQRGTTSGKDSLSQLIISFFKDKTISGLKHSGELISILSLDGMTLFNKDGVLVDAGIIINTSTTPGVVTGGGRTTAATAASLYGKVIKVSEDGPIELYERGKCIYRFG
ncbi:MAG: hypothetical protein H6Q57_1717 [Geobacteraceae bacterium]|nr:hypothetical protein [Geobacteraceae bacterium]